MMSRTRRRLTITGAIAAGLLGLAVLAFVSSVYPADAGAPLDTTGPVPAGKGSVAGAAQSFTGQLPQHPAAVLAVAAADAGDPNAVAKVKTDAVNSLQGLRAAMRLPTAVPERVAMVADVVQIARSAQALQQVVSVTKVTDFVADIQAALKTVAADPTYRSYQDNRFIVDSWQGVKVNGSSASALLNGHDSYFDAKGWADDVSRQWQLELTLEGGVWKLVSQKSISLPPAAPTVSARRK